MEPQAYCTYDTTGLVWAHIYGPTPSTAAAFAHELMAPWDADYVVNLPFSNRDHFGVFVERKPK